MFGVVPSWYKRISREHPGDQPGSILWVDMVGLSQPGAISLDAWSGMRKSQLCLG